MLEWVCIEQAFTIIYSILFSSICFLYIRQTYPVLNKIINKGVYLIALFYLFLGIMVGVITIVENSALIFNMIFGLGFLLVESIVKLIGSLITHLLFWPTLIIMLSIYFAKTEIIEAIQKNK